MVILVIVAINITIVTSFVCHSSMIRTLLLAKYTKKQVKTKLDSSHSHWENTPERREAGEEKIRAGEERGG